MIQEALDEEAAGASTFDAEEVFAEMDAILEERIRAAGKRGFARYQARARTFSRSPDTSRSTIQPLRAP